MEDGTIIQRPPDSRSGSRAGSSLPPDLLAKARRRVATVAWLVLFAVGLDSVFLVIGGVAFLTGASGERPNLLWILGNLVSLSMASALVIAVRDRRVSNERLLDLALVFEVLICLTISISSPDSMYADRQQLPVLTWVTPLMCFFPMIVPCPPRRTLITATLAAATAPLGLAILDMIGSVPIEPRDYASISFGPTIAIVIAYFGSRVIYGLGMDVAAARRMGSYRLVRQLGAGGMGEVWLAEHALLARPAAIKLVRRDLLTRGGALDGQVALDRFEREAQATASLRSPHTIAVYDYGVATGGTFYYVMEHLEGFTVEELVQRFGPQPAERVAHLAKQICHSLAEAHATGLLHRDVKPSNVFVCHYGRDADFVKVLDFGLVKLLGRPEVSDPTLTAEGVVCGTPAYMAPELALRPDEGDARSDLYALGCVAYWMLTGHHVFEAEAPLAVLAQHLHADPTPPSQRTELPIPPALEELVLQLLAKDPAQRPGSADEVAERLEAIEFRAPWTKPRATEWWRTHEPRRRS